MTDQTRTDVNCLKCSYQIDVGRTKYQLCKRKLHVYVKVSKRNN